MANELLSRADRSSEVIVVYTLRAVLRGSSVAGSAAEVLKLLEPSSRALKVLLAHLQVLLGALVHVSHVASHQICVKYDSHY